jgi:hypothetical protein
MNNKQRTLKGTQQKGWSALSTPEKGKEQGADLHANFQETKTGKAEGPTVGG